MRGNCWAWQHGFPCAWLYDLKVGTQVGAARLEFSRREWGDWNVEEEEGEKGRRSMHSGRDGSSGCEGVI